MRLIRLAIPAAFLMARAPMTWRELQFGFVNELLDPHALVDFARREVACLECPSNTLLDLAGASRGESVRALVDWLAAGEPECLESQLRDKWLYLTLAWIYEDRGAFPEPLQTIAMVYADFGYPEEIAGFVYYMPMVGPDLCSREANERRLLERWKQYLDTAASRYAS